MIALSLLQIAELGGALTRPQKRVAETAIPNSNGGCSEITLVQIQLPMALQFKGDRMMPPDTIPRPIFPPGKTVISVSEELR